MRIRPSRDEQSYRDALATIERLWGAAIGTEDGDDLDVLITLVEAYENEHYPIPEADPVEILHYAIEDMGRSQAELAELLGSRSRASEVLNRRRALTLDMIRTISEAWRIPAEVLMKPYGLARETA